MKHKKTLALIFVIAAFSLIMAFLFSLGLIRLNNPSYSKYPVRGVDVSSYQGKIDWQVLSKNNIDFAYIKATEGSSYKDSEFSENFEKAKETQLYIGAYHFMSFDSSGLSQAENFISTVKKSTNTLPCAVDVELYGKYKKSPLEKASAEKIISTILQKLENYYSRKPIIYCTKRSYDLYIKDNFSSYPIWIRNVYTSPEISGISNWKLWQYSDKGRMNGFSGEEKYIDLNVFNGSKKEFEQFFINGL